MRANFPATFAAMLLVMMAAARGQGFADTADAADSDGRAQPLMLQLDIYGNSDRGFADEPMSSELSIGIGWANFGIGGSDSALDGESMLRFDPVVSFSLFEPVPQLRLGFGLGVGLNFDSSDRIFISNSNGLTVFG